MAEAIIKLLKDKKLREKLGHAGKEYAKQFDWAVLGKKMEELILDSIKSK